MQLVEINIDKLRAQLITDGWIHLSQQSESDLTHILDKLGDTIFTTDVIIRPESKSMITSERGLNFHSDHPQAKYIVWYCYQQTDNGGKSILMDAEKVFLQLSKADKEALHNVYLKEHKVFADDKEFYPLVESKNGERKFYFSFWLLKESDRENSALLNFKEAINKTEHIELTLMQNDILIVDNHRFLHGRTPIAGSKNRHLRRFWISNNTFHKQLNSVPMATTALKIPTSITQERIAFLVGKKIDTDIASIDLEMVKMKLSEPKEGIGWSKEQVEDAEIEYKRYLHLTRHFPYPDYSIVPNKIMDTMWHYHILDTRAYHRDCDKVFGHYIHHFPYFGLRGEEDARNLYDSFLKTKEYYLQTFGEDLARNREADCWHDCEERCWHACDNRQ